MSYGLALSAMLERSSSSMFSRLFGRVLSACWSAFTAELLRPFRDVLDV